MAEAQDKVDELVDELCNVIDDQDINTILNALAYVSGHVLADATDDVYSPKLANEYLAHINDLYRGMCDCPQETIN